MGAHSVRGTRAEGDSRTGGRAGPRRPLWALGGLLVAGLVAVVVAMAIGDDPAGPEDDNRRSPGTSVEVADQTTLPPSPAGDLGTVEVTGTASPSCPLEECIEVEVQCPDVQPVPAVVAFGPPGDDPAGVVVLLSGAQGNTFWANPNQRGQANVVTDIADRGLLAIEVAWPGDGWAAAPSGEPVGFAKVACRSATLIRWLHDERYAPLELDPEPATCGFCVSGNSGGASQIAYSLAYYGLDEIIDVAVLSSGPPHADLARGCLGEPGDEQYSYAEVSVPLIDSAYGATSGEEGPCAARDPAFAERWRADSVAVGGNDYVHETTRIEVLLGGLDRTVAPAQGQLYVDRLLDAGSPMVQLQEIPEMEHEVLAERTSRNAVVDAILGTSGG